MPKWENEQAFADEWIDACNSHDLDRISALYAEDVVFKSPRVEAVSGEKSGTIRGRAAVRDYWRRTLEMRPDLEFAPGRVFAGVDSIALEFHVKDSLHGIEFMLLDADGEISFACGNYSTAKNTFRRNAP